MKVASVALPVSITAPPPQEATGAGAASGGSVGVASPPAVHGLGADTEVLRAGQSALAGMGDIDHARVLEIRGALERGEIVFDAAKLARLIERHHGQRGSTTHP